MAYSDRELLARLIECEAGGEGENGMKAVAALASSAAKTPSAPQQVTAATIRMVTNSLLNLVFIMEPSVIFCFIPRPSVKALL